MSMNAMGEAKMVRWGSSYNRLFNIHKLDIYAAHMERELRRYFRHGLSHLLAVGSGQDVRWHFDQDEFVRFEGAIVRRTWRDAVRGENHVRQMIRQAALAIKSISHFETEDFSSYSSRDLYRSFRLFRKTVDASLPLIYAGVAIENGLLKKAKKVLGQRFRGMALEKAFTAVTIPTALLPITQEEMDLCTLRLRGITARRIMSHMKRYRWMGMRFVDYSPKQNTFFQERAHQMTTHACRVLLRRYRAERTQRFRNFNSAIRYFVPAERRFLRLVNEYSALRHQRDVYRGTTYCFGHYLYEAIRQRMGCAWDELSTYTTSELERYLRTGIRLSRKVVAHRSRHFLFLLMGGTITIMTDRLRSARFKRQLGQVSAHTVTATAVLNGTVAYPGNAQGTVRIIRLNSVLEDLAALRSGEIMVTATTKPEYVPSMRRSAAVITNEGGLTCHAAIIAREFRIPTIIGTRVATKVLKTGDRIAVDAGSGRITRLT